MHTLPTTVILSATRRDPQPNVIRNGTFYHFCALVFMLADDCRVMITETKIWSTKLIIAKGANKHLETIISDIIFTCSCVNKTNCQLLLSRPMD